MAFSTTSSTKTPISASRNPGVDSCYFPNCRKDANCHCEICIESFNATIDLHSALRFPTKKKNRSKNTSSPSTPQSTPEPISSISIDPRTPVLKSTARSKPKVDLRRKEKGRSWAFGYAILVVFVGVSVIWSVDFGVLELGLKGFGPKLGVEIARELGEEAKVSERSLKGRLEVVERKVEGLVGGGNGGVYNCSSLDSAWKLNQDGGLHLFFQWRCIIYQSTAEELSVWGSPLQTSGILVAGISSRSLTLLSGKLSEWSEGKLVPTSRTANGSSWTIERLSSAVVQLEEETWVLEYQRNALFDNPRLIQYLWENLRLRMQRSVRKMKGRMMLSRTFGSSYHRIGLANNHHFQHPT